MEVNSINISNSSNSLNIVENLNEQQQLAVNTVEGPLLILAGAGTGKTKTLVSRIANIIENNHALPHQVMAVTFTNKAAGEMINRVKIITGNIDFHWVGTFHSIAAKILRIHATEIGLNSSFTIIDTDDQLKLLKKVASELNFETEKTMLKRFLEAIQTWKDQALDPNKIKYNNSLHNRTSNFFEKQALQCYELYQKKLKENNCADFGDLLFYNITLFNKNPEILTHYRERFKYLMVDEYQDTNSSQYLWLKLLAQNHQNICCVGDDDQSIYGWRGAEIKNILNFSKDFKDAKIIKLERNYRSTNEILKAADQVISKNKARLAKKLWTSAAPAEKVQILSFRDGKEEATHIINLIAQSQTVNQNLLLLKNTAILVRASFQTRLFEEVCIIRKLAYRIVGGIKFYERKEVKDIIAYLRLSATLEDNLAFERIVNTPKRGLGDSTINHIAEAALEQHCSMFTAAKLLLETNQIKSKILPEFLKQVETWGAELEKFSLADFLKKLMLESGYLKMLKANDEEAKIENLQELLNVAAQFNNIIDFLQHVSLVAESDKIDEQNVLNIMTLHSSKGLEFEQVFLPGWEEGVFPHRRCYISPEQLEEERRLAYVGITRAKKRLTISHASRRFINNTWQNSSASRFILDLVGLK